jgi:hypothetical protein
MTHEESSKLKIGDTLWGVRNTMSLEFHPWDSSTWVKQVTIAKIEPLPVAGGVLIRPEIAPGGRLEGYFSDQLHATKLDACKAIHAEMVLDYQGLKRALDNMDKEIGYMEDEAATVEETAS